MKLKMINLISRRLTYEYYVLKNLNKYVLMLSKINFYDY